MPAHPRFRRPVKPFLSLKTKLVAVMVGLTLLSTGLTGSALLWRAYRALRVQAQQGQLALARSLAAQVDDSMSQALQSVEVLALRPDVVSLSPSGLKRELSLVASTTELLDGLAVVLPDGSFKALNLSNLTARNLPTPAAIREFQLQLKDQSDEGVLVELYRGRSGDMGVAFNTPILRKGRPVAMLTGLMLFANHEIGNLEDIHIGQTGYAYLVDDKGRLIARPERTRPPNDLSREPVASRFLNEQEGVAEYKDDAGRGILAAYAKIESVSWGVVVRQSAAECYGPAFRMVWTLSIFLALFIAVSSGLALWLAGRVVKPLLTLSEEVRRFESGRLDPSGLEALPPGDEVGQVALALSRMARALKAQQAEREQAHQRALDAEKRLSESERLAALGQLAAGLAHELNNPLAVIVGSARESLMRKGASVRPWVERIQREGERCLRLVKDLLDFARPMTLRRRRLDLLELVASSFEQALQGRAAAYTLKAPRGRLACQGDADRLKQVFLNLFINAMDAMPQGGALEVGLEKEPGLARLRLRDGGPGLSRADLDALFRPFFTTKPKGTGLGLSICRSIVQAHGGRVWADPPDGGGAVFVVELPLPARPPRAAKGAKGGLA